MCVRVFCDMAKGKLTKTVSPTKSTTPKAAQNKLTFLDFPTVFNATLEVYKRKTDLQVKVIDSFLAIVMVIGIVNGVYGVVFARTPIKPVVSALISCVATFVLGGNNGLDCASYELI